MMKSRFILEDEDIIIKDLKIMNSSKSSNTKGNPHHADDGKFTFAPYQKYPLMEQSAKKIVAARKKVEHLFTSDALGESYPQENNVAKQLNQYYDIIAEERIKLFKQYSEGDEQDKKREAYKANEKLYNWTIGITGEYARTYEFNPIDVALSQSIAREIGIEQNKVYRVQINANKMKSSTNLSFSFDKTNMKRFIRDWYEGDKEYKSSSFDFFEVSVKPQDVVMMPDVLYSGDREIFRRYAGGYYETSWRIKNQKEIVINYRSGAKNIGKLSYDEIFDDKKKNSLHLNAQFSEDGVIQDYGQYIESRLVSRKQSFLKEIQTIQLDAIKNADNHLIVNEINLSDITSPNEKENIFNRLYDAIKKYWLFLFGILGQERLKEDEESTGIQKKKPINLLGTSSINRDIEKNAKKAAESHTNTIYKTIIEAGQKAENNIFSRLFVSEFLRKREENPDYDIWFKETPSERQIKSKLNDKDFKSKNKEIIEFVRDKIDKGYGNQEIQRAIKSQYSTLSKRRAQLLVNNETTRATVRSQYFADLEFLKNTGYLNRAYKQLESNTGNPCPICQELIDKGPIPFKEAFVELGDEVIAQEDDKTITFKCDYETVEAGCVHCNCRCTYKLIIK